MFDLNEAVTLWCRRIQPGFLCHNRRLELEDHLHCTIQSLVDRGYAQEQAFQIATERIGDSKSVRAEFDKNRSWKSRQLLLGRTINHRPAMLVGTAVLLAVVTVGVLWQNAPLARGLIIALCDLSHMFFGISSK